MDDVVLGLNRSSINPLSVLGTVIKFGSDWNIPTMFCGDARNAALFVERILWREWTRMQEAKKMKAKEQVR
jgi:phosphoribosylcarboxyaminoimidazole (NCAIR) mutase